jgi:hypothetical protein
MEKTFFQVLHLGKRVQADLHFVSDALHFHMQHGRRFQHKIAPEECDHERENSIFKRRKYFYKNPDLC